MTAMTECTHMGAHPFPQLRIRIRRDDCYCYVGVPDFAPRFRPQISSPDFARFRRLDFADFGYSTDAPVAAFRLREGKY